MDRLSVTLIDVGWGDSIFIEASHGNNKHYAFIDSNDETTNRTSYHFVKRYLEKNDPNALEKRHLFDFVILSHWHLDHGKGLKYLMSKYGTQNFWYPKTNSTSNLTDLMSYGRRSSKVVSSQSIDDTKTDIRLGPVEVDVLWPFHDQIMNDENENSLVLNFKLGNASFLLTGDAEEHVWSNIAANLPANTRFFKLPHHGSVNGAFNANDQSEWFDQLQAGPKYGISAHIRPYTHPDDEVITLLNNNNCEYYRTDEHYHVTFTTDGVNDLDVKYSHV